MTFEADAEIVIQALSDFYQRSATGEDWVIRLRPMDELVSEMQLPTLVKEGGLSGEKLVRFVDAYLAGITRIYHPANIAHQQAVKLFIIGTTDKHALFHGPFTIAHSMPAVQGFTIHQWFPFRGILGRRLRSHYPSQA